ncbi:MAG: ABC transporter permease [Clostridia bacterium]|nr:ABC transporter permease [Clostridia bacterium]
MISAFNKNALREIKNSIGRFLAITAIIALGVGFFSGLKVSQNAMVKTGNKYTDEYNLFDYRLISTLGFSKDDVQKIASEFPEADTVAGALSEDFIYNDNSVEYVIRAHSITPGVNDLKLCAGTLPKGGAECVGDSRFFTEEQIGSVITVNEKSEDSKLKYGKYTITGIVSSPYYLNFERGTTSLKNGSISAFVYIPQDGWDSEYYTEIFLKFADTGYLFSDEYDEAVSVYKNRLTEKTQALAAERYKNIVSQIKDKYGNSLSEYNGNIQNTEQEAGVFSKEPEKSTTGISFEDDKLLSKPKEPVCYVLGRDTNIGYSCFRNDSQIVDGIANVFPVFFFLVAALVCMTTMTRMVDDHRTQIGVLKSLGYGKAAIIGKYTAYSGSAAAIGCTIGFIVGSITIPKIIWIVFDIMYGFAPLVTVFDPVLAVISLTVSLLCSVGATLADCFKVFSDVPAQLIRPAAPKAGKRVFLEHIHFIWKRLKFLHKVSIRNIFRYKKRFVMMVLGIGGCTALLLTGFGIRDSIQNIAVFQFDEIELFDSSVSFMSSTDSETVDTIREEYSDIISNALLMYESGVTVTADKESKSVKMRVPAQTDLNNFVNFHNADGEVSFPEKGFAIINTNLAKMLDISVGDKLTLADGDEKRTQVTVSGIFDNYVYNYIYLSAETYEQCFGESPQYKTAFINFSKNSDVHEAAAKLSDCDLIASLSVNRDMRDRVSNMLYSLDYIVLMVIVCAGALAFIVLYNLTNINITERIREIATIKVLGFRPIESASYVYRENLILTLFGAVLGLLLGNGLLSYVMSQIKIDVVSFDTRLSVPSYLYSILLTFAFTALVNILLFFKLKKINMAESLKSIE